MQTHVIMNNESVPAGEFTPAEVKNLPFLSPEQLAALEEQLSKEYADLATHFLQARLVRVDELLKAINTNLDIFEKNEAEWSDVFHLRMDQINKLMNITEDRILHNEEAEVDFDKKVNQLFSQRVLPLTHAAVSQNLPFEQFFDKVQKPFVTQLEAIRNEQTYQQALLQNTAEASVQREWLTYYKDVTEHRQLMIDQTYRDLSNLYQDYNEISSHKRRSQLAAKYYRSTVPVTKAKSHILKRTKVQLTDAKVDVLHLRAKFENAQRGAALNGCIGLSEADIQHDLEAMSGSFKETAPGADEGGHHRTLLSLQRERRTHEPPIKEEATPSLKGH